ncbi:MAG: adenosine deaminase [Deltaproteobacteria bacterium]|nr:adenosine deaminase [Deltaproteobacteria bacterium]MCB9788139.1 adenosine deaminase [Deltaproteobacteria bacterium]
MFTPDRAFIERLPKTDLHVHLDGSMRLSTILELADARGVKLPATDEAGLAKAIHMGEICQDLNDYLRAFDITLSVLQDEEALRRAAYELAEDAARENVRYMEVRYSPILHTRKGAALTRIVESVIEGLADARRDHGIACNVIICGIRHIEPQQSLRLAEVASAYKNKGVCGFDLAGAEYDYPPKQHREAFYLVRNNNVRSTIHAGEAYGPESIHQAIHVCGAHRIGHGTRLREDGELLNYVTDQRIPLEVCLSSNVQTRAVRDFQSHPLGFYFDFGVRVTINTDNRLITNATVTDEYVRAVETFGFDATQVKQLIINGFKSAFLPFHERQTILRRVNQEVSALIEEEVARLAATNAEAPVKAVDPATPQKKTPGATKAATAA